MAFSSTQTGRVPLGDQFLVYGTYTSDGGSTGGDISTNLQVVNTFNLQPKGAAVLATQDVVNETFPLYNNPISNDTKVTIVTAADSVGYWQAIGK